MKQIALTAAIALTLGVAQANAGLLDSLTGLFGGGGIECATVDAECLTGYAAGILGDTETDGSVNAYGATLGRMWPHLAPETRDKHHIDFVYLFIW